MSIPLIDKIVPQNNAFTGLVDARQVIGGTGNNLPVSTLPTNGGLGNSINYLSWVGSTAMPSGDLTTSIQNFLLYCQLVALSLKDTSLTNLAQRTCINAYIPDGRYTISCPIIVPEYVNLVCDGVFVRTGSSGTVTNFYTGDTTTKALANLVQPAICLVPHAHANTGLSIVCNSNGSDRGSGLVIGKTWCMASVGITAAGSGYSVNDVLTFNQPSVSPYIAATATVTGINGSGGITGIILSAQGAYGLPPVQQASQWTTANGFNVFDTYGNIGVTGGTGTGASLSNTWVPDFVGGDYIGSQQGGVISDTIIGHLNIVQSQRYSDPTYGPIFIIQHNNLNTVFDEIESEEGFNAIWLRFSADMRINRINTVNPQYGMVLYASSSIECPNVVIDTPTGDSACMIIDQATEGIRFTGRIFNRNLNNLPSGTPSALINIGLFSTTVSYDIRLDFTVYGGGAGGDGNHISTIGSAALYLAYVTSFAINLNISNRVESFGGLYPVINSFCQFGSNVGVGRITGNIDHTFGPLLSGTIPPGVDFDIWDADVSITNASITATIGGTVTSGNNITITFTNAQFAKTYAWPRTPNYTVTGGDTTTTIATALAAAINADAALSINGVVATSSVNVITIIQMGCDANNTTLSATITGSATETVTFSNGGAMSGSVCGGRMRSAGLYELSGNGAPTNGTTGTGWAKTPKGSTYIDYSTGNFYINKGSASSPNWVQIS